MLLNYSQCILTRHLSTIFYLEISWFLNKFKRKSDALILARSPSFLKYPSGIVISDPIYMRRKSPTLTSFS